ncbi:MAG: hypothetical protein WC895_03325 [Candidatus Shapirobacteria bacterium]
MISKKTKFSLITILLISLVLIFSEVTTADLSVQLIAEDNQMTATTLQFSTRDTSNENETPYLFKTQGLIYDGFDVESIRIKKDGYINFNYQIKANKTSGDDIFCNALQLKIMQNDKFIYNGKLLELDNSKFINDNGKDDWIFFLSLNNNDDQLKNKNCEFEFNFKTWRKNVDETGGFKDNIKVINFVSSGNW